MADALTDQLSKAAKTADDASKAFWDAKSVLSTLQSLDYDSKIDGLATDEDGTFPDSMGTLDDVTPEDVRIEAEALSKIESLLDEASETNASRTLRDGINAMRAAHR